MKHILLALILASSIASALSCGDTLDWGLNTLSGNLFCTGAGLAFGSGTSTLDCQGFTISGNGSGVAVTVNRSSHNTIRNCILTNFERGVSIYYSQNTTITSNSITNNSHGVVIENSHVNNLTNNNISENLHYGVYFDQVSLGSNIDNNFVCANNQVVGDSLDILNGGPKLDPPDDPPFIHHPGLDLAPFDNDTLLAGGLVFDPAFGKVFWEMGVVVDSHLGGYKRLPEYTFYMAEDASVYAMFNGTMTMAAYQPDSLDYEISIVPSDPTLSNYILFIDHIMNLTVSVSDPVSTGDFLGTPGKLYPFPGPYNDPRHDNSSFGIVEYAIRKDDVSHCPTRFFSDSAFSSFNESLNRLMNEWEEYKSDYGVYNLSDHAGLGCLLYEYSESSYGPNSGGVNTCGTVLNFNDSNQSGACASFCTTPVSTTSTTSTTSTSTTSTTTVPVILSVNITDTQFVPSSISINVSNYVNWTNKDSTVHRVVDDNETLFDSGNLSQGQSYSFQFPNPMNLTYHCQVNPSLTGSITVEPDESRTLLIVGWNLISLALNI